MIAELIMHYSSFGDVWYAHPGRLINAIRWSGRWHVGNWTGPQHDLICVKNCSTNAEAERWLSPGGRTILSAAIKALWLLLTGPKDP